MSHAKEASSRMSKRSHFLSIIHAMVFCLMMLQTPTTASGSCTCPSCAQRDPVQRCKCCVYRQLGKRSHSFDIRQLELPEMSSGDQKDLMESSQSSNSYKSDFASNPSHDTYISSGRSRISGRPMQAVELAAVLLELVEENNSLFKSESEMTKPRSFKSLASERRNRLAKEFVEPLGGLDQESLQRWDTV